MAANLNVASNRFATGAVLKSDWLDAEVRLAAARENLVRAENGVALAETIFRNVLGVGEEDQVTAGEEAVGGRVATDSPAADGAASASPSIGLRPELLAAKNAVAIAEKQVRSAVGGYYPRVNAFASYDLDSGDASRFKDSWVAGVSVELDVFDGFQTRGKVAEARANLEAAREELRRTELMLALEVKQAELSLAEATARLTTTERAVAQAEESLQITKERYGNGLVLLTQVLDAETAWAAARQRRIAAATDYRIAAAALAKASGTIGKEQE
jgi:outer membrane protein TolC